MKQEVFKSIADSLVKFATVAVLPSLAFPSIYIENEVNGVVITERVKLESQHDE